MTQKAADSVPVIRDVYPYLSVRDAARALELYTSHLGAEELLRPLAFGGTGTTIHLHVDDVDTLTARAREAGATVLREPTDYGHGERQSRLRDPFGHEWLLGHELESVTLAEIRRRFEAEQGGEVSS